MSRLGSPPGGRRVAVVKPKSDIYVVLLALSLTAMLIACVLLLMEFQSYGWQVKAAWSPATQPVRVAEASPGRGVVVAASRSGGALMAGRLA